jgi:hypothetical protein
VFFIKKIKKATTTISLAARALLPRLAMAMAKAAKGGEV